MVLFDFRMHFRFPLGNDLLEPRPYLVLALLPSFILLLESSFEAQFRDQRLQGCAVEFLGKTYRNFFSPDKERCYQDPQHERKRNLQTKPDLVSGLTIVSELLNDCPRWYECTRHKPLHFLPMKKYWMKLPWLDVRFGRCGFGGRSFGWCSFEGCGFGRCDFGRCGFGGCGFGECSFGGGGFWGCNFLNDEGRKHLVLNEKQHYHRRERALSYGQRTVNPARTLTFSS